MADSRHRHFSFTQNNYETTDMADAVPCRYMVYGKETGASGTPHLQGHVCFENKKRINPVIKLMPGCHIAVSKAPEKSIAYCKKGEQTKEEWEEHGTAGPNYGLNADVTERGEAPRFNQKGIDNGGGAEEQARWKAIRLAAEEGRFDDIPEDIRFTQDLCIDRHRQRGLKKRKLEDTEEKHQWYYGASGTGKSRKARTENPDAYLKNCNKWWDGYEEHETVLIEDFDKKHDVLGHHLKIWADRYPFHAEVKGGGTGTIRPKTIIVTSNWHPEDIWTDERDLEPILRRFHVTRFGDGTFQAAQGLRAFANSTFQ